MTDPTLSEAIESIDEMPTELAPDPSPLQAQPVESATRPDGLPDKFWDEEKSDIRTDSLLKSYLTLEKRLGGQGQDTVPESVDGYSITPPSDLVNPDPSLNARLHEAGFTQNQAQMVYDLAGEHLYPLVTQMSVEMEAQHQISRLAEEFGGEDSWRDLSAQIASWGKANYPTDVYQALASSVDGVKSMHQMMSKGEPGLLDPGSRATGGVNENSLKSLMRDPRYWRDQDPTIVAEVRAGFQKLYPEND